MNVAPSGDFAPDSLDFLFTAVLAGAVYLPALGDGQSKDRRSQKERKDTE